MAVGRVKTGAHFAGLVYHESCIRAQKNCLIKVTGGRSIGEMSLNRDSADAVP